MLFDCSVGSEETETRIFFHCKILSDKSQITDTHTYIDTLTNNDKQNIILLVKKHTD